MYQRLIEHRIGRWGSEHIVCPSLSVRLMLGAPVRYFLDGGRRQVGLDESSFLVLNEDQPYGLEKPGREKVESLCVFFPKAWVQSVSAFVLGHRGSLNPSAGASSIGFRDNTRPHVASVTPTMIALLGYQRAVRAGFSRSADSQIARDREFLQDPEDLVMNLLERLVRLEVHGRESGAHRSRGRARSIVSSAAEPSRAPPRPFAGSKGLASERERRLANARDYIHARLDDPIRLDELASVAAMSPFHFLRAFARRFGCTPARYVVRERMRRARVLLRTTAHPVREIARDVGYQSDATFSRIFKSDGGLTPTQYRLRSL